LGDFTKSRELLTGVVTTLQKQSPPNLVELPAALLNLAVAELATSQTSAGRARAAQRGRDCLTLYEKNKLPADLVLVETCNLLGTCAAQEGDYARAIAHFDTGVKHCGSLGSAADTSHCALLLNVARLHKAQGDLDNALKRCQEARTVYERFAAPGSLGFTALDAAEAALLAVQPSRLKEANALAEKVLEGCRRHGREGGPLVITARH